MLIDYKNHQDESIRKAYLKAQTLAVKKLIKDKERLERMEEISARENLEQTKICAEVWKLYRGGNLEIDYYLLTNLESLVWQNLCDEWGEESKIEFDYDNNVVICSHKNRLEKI